MPTPKFMGLKFCKKENREHKNQIWQNELYGISAVFWFFPEIKLKVDHAFILVLRAWNIQSHLPLLLCIHARSEIADKF